jgi:hypothetical protein
MIIASSKVVVDQNAPTFWGNGDGNAGSSR